ncbi:MAG: UrcA family protein [Hyphomonadaceae bacterium]
MKKAILPIFAALSLAATPAAFASDNFEFEFEFSPVEVSTEDGAAAVYSDLETLIEEECAPLGNSAPIEEFRYRASTKICIDQALSEAVAQIQSPEVTKVHEAKRG